MMREFNYYEDCGNENIMDFASDSEAYEYLQDEYGDNVEYNVGSYGVYINKSEHNYILK